MNKIIPPLDPGEYAPFHAQYIANVPEHPVDAMRSQGEATHAWIAGLTEEQGHYRYAPDKWSVSDVIGHLIDAERISAYRALRIGRGDVTPLPAWDQDLYATVARADRQPIADLAEAYWLVRGSTVALFESFRP